MLGSLKRRSFNLQKLPLSQKLMKIARTFDKSLSSVTGRWTNHYEYWKEYICRLCLPIQGKREIVVTGQFIGRGPRRWRVPLGNVEETESSLPIVRGCTPDKMRGNVQEPKMKMKLSVRVCLCVFVNTVHGKRWKNWTHNHYKEDGLKRER